MKLLSISIQGYKSFTHDSPQVIWTGDRDVVIGANGAGKSNLISLFKMIGLMTKGKLRAFVSHEGGAQRMLYYGPKFTHSIILEIKIEHDDAWYDYYAILELSAPNSLVFANESISKISDRLEMDISKVESYSGESMLALPTLDKWQQLFHDFLDKIKVYQFNDSSFTSSMRGVCHKDINSDLRPDAGNLAAYLLRIKNNYPMHYKRIVDYVRMVVPQFGNFSLAPDDNGNVMLTWTDNTSTDYQFIPHQLSDGSLRFIALATLLLQPEELMPSVIVIDEPELGLHPEAIGSLVEMIKDASIHTQVLVATQSPELLDGFDIENIHVIESNVWKERNCSRIQNFYEEEDREGLNAWLEEYAISELWNKNIIGGRP